MKSFQCFQLHTFVTFRLFRSRRPPKMSWSLDALQFCNQSSFGRVCPNRKHGHYKLSISDGMLSLRTQYGSWWWKFVGVNSCFVLLYIIGNEPSTNKLFGSLVTWWRCSVSLWITSRVTLRQHDVISAPLHCSVLMLETLSRCIGNIELFRAVQPNIPSIPVLPVSSTRSVP